MNSQRHGADVWQNVSDAAKEDEDFPVRVVEYYPDEHVMVGDFRLAASRFNDAITSQFLVEVADWLEATNKEYMHGLEDEAPRLL